MRSRRGRSRSGSATSRRCRRIASSAGATPYRSKSRAPRLRWRTMATVEVSRRRAARAPGAPCHRRAICGSRGGSTSGSAWPQGRLTVRRERPSGTSSEATSGRTTRTCSPRGTTVNRRHCCFTSGAAAARTFRSRCSCRPSSTARRLADVWTTASAPGFGAPWPTGRPRHPSRCQRPSPGRPGTSPLPSTTPGGSATSAFPTPSCPLSSACGSTSPSGC
mmetsp:Transcript_60348/g.184341  ORF Transcript_60348/g.184341 Transcript_60348/m.184341 type:complete len:220 (-) Transcript_60348:990-1649(-)